MSVIQLVVRKTGPNRSHLVNAIYDVLGSIVLLAEHPHTLSLILSQVVLYHSAVRAVGLTNHHITQSDIHAAV